MLLEEITPNLTLVGIEPTQVVTVVAAIAIAADHRQVIYRRPDGSLGERLVTRAEEASLALAVTERPWAFDGDGATFQLAVEAKRIDLAYLFDPMMAVHASTVTPLPHQITAVYESMLPRQPLRYVLADDPGAGKTIMAGLYVRELIMRADARRILIVAPGSLVEQWREELFRKFGLEFRVYSNELEQTSPSGNPFEDHDQLIARLDQLARRDDLHDRLCAVPWDLVIFDEAHKLSAHFFGQEIKTTRRFELAKRLGATTRHLLLMTATPHNGKEEDFQLFLSLLDSDRFYGRFRGATPRADASDLMRRMVKEQLVKFDGTPLFPPRFAYTANYPLSVPERELYELVTRYVREQMGKADQLEGARRGSVGFALTTLQRRLASSPEAIYQSLRRRRERLDLRLRELRRAARTQVAPDPSERDVPDDDDDLSADEQEQLEEVLVDQATAAKTLTELEAEVLTLHALEQHARRLVASNVDHKWEQLSSLLQDDPRLRDATGQIRKLIIFTEHRDTLTYLVHKLGGPLGEQAVVAIHGGTDRLDRLRLQEQFRSDPTVRVLVATDAAGEGVNLQTANLMVNYDLPWNPNRLEQRFGRIHRIGQEQPCHLWSLVAKETREGEVYHQLLVKLAVESAALKGRVFDILGEVFEEVSLKDLLLRAIRDDEAAPSRPRIIQQLDAAFAPDRVRSLLERSALAHETMSPERLYRVKEDMERAEARRLQPYFIRSFFLKAFKEFAGVIHPREAERYEISHVPAAIRERDEQMPGRARRAGHPVIKRYDRICFTKDATLPPSPGAAPAVLMHPGHPLMMAMTDVLLERHANLLRQGAILVDPVDDGVEPHLLFLLGHDIRSGDQQVLSKRLQFVRVGPDGVPSFAGWAPHLDLEPLEPADRPRLGALLAAPWIRAELEQRALELAARELVPEHYAEVAARRVAHIDRTLAAVHERLTAEIRYQTDRWTKLNDDRAAGKDVRLPLQHARNTIDDLNSRLERRRRELQAMRHVVSATPIALGGALIVPAGLLRKLRGEPNAGPTWSQDAAARARIERLAMDAVTRAEEARGCRVVDVSKAKCGWDLTSYPPAGADGVIVEARHLEVKGRVKGSTTITVTRNEVCYALNQAERFALAIVLVGEDGTTEGPFYVRRPFTTEPDWNVASINYDLAALLERAEEA